jgi:hypothetical protein
LEEKVNNDKCFDTEGALAKFQIISRFEFKMNAYVFTFYTHGVHNVIFMNLEKLKRFYNRLKWRARFVFTP